MEKKFYITTAIDYVNGEPHIGHALEKIQADVLARYHRLLGEDVFFLTGTDENAQKNVLAAEKAGIPVQEFVEKNVQSFKNLVKVLNISNDEFIQTSDKKKHWPGVIKLWQECQKAGDIYKKEYTGLYCVGCEAFVTEKELDNSVCPEHLKAPEKVSEENYFFRLSKYQDQLIDLIESDRLKIIPEKRKNEILNFLRSGLEDLSISRCRERMRNWGIPVPGDESQVVYVWFDALGNYITSLGYGREDDSLFKKYWPADIHVIGKGISRFHAIYWPAFLLSAGVILPKTIFIHDYINIRDQKISKTLGNTVNPIDLVDKYGADPIRYFFLREISPFQDGDFTIEKLEQRYNSDLAKGLGNLVSRVLTMAEKYCNGKVPEIDQDPEKHPLMVPELKTWKDLDANMKSYQFNEALASIWQFITEADKYIEETKPWELSKQGKEKELNWVIYGLLDALHQIAWLIYPFIPSTATKIAEALNIEKLLTNNPLYKDSWTNLESGGIIRRPKSLFPTITGEKEN